MQNLRAQQLKAERRQLIAEYKATRGCTDCGEQDPRCLDLDHRGDKSENVSVLVSEGRSLAVIMAEVSKCDVRCSNCHRKRHTVLRGRMV